jgi:hypothetical protein
VQKINSIFSGKATNKTRSFIGKLLEGNTFKKYVIPDIANFTTAQLFEKSDVKPKLITVADVSLFPTLMGYFITGKDIESLNIEFEGVPFNYKKFKKQEDKIAEIFLCIKYLQLPEKHYYNDEIRNELVENREEYHNKIKADLVKLKAKLNGIKFNSANTIDLVRKHMDDPDCLIYLQAPNKKDEIRKLYDFPDNLYWNNPMVPEYLDPESFELFMKEIVGAKATILINVNTKEIPPKKWFRLLTEDKGEMVGRVLCNKNLTKTLTIPRKKNKFDRLPLPIYDGHDITKHCKIDVIKINKDQAAYFRDLFIHKLATTGAEVTLAVTIDGQVLTPFGLNLNGLYENDKEGKPRNYVFEVFGITVPTPRYKHLGRLFNMFLTCESMKEKILELVPSTQITNMEGLRTTSLARYPEHRLVHGIHKLVQKHRTPNGYWHTTYQTKFHERTFKECIIHWLNDERRYEQIQGKSSTKRN